MECVNWRSYTPLANIFYIRYIDGLRASVYFTKRFSKALEDEVNSSFLFPVFFFVFFFHFKYWILKNRHFRCIKQNTDYVMFLATLYKYIIIALTLF